MNNHQGAAYPPEIPEYYYVSAPTLKELSAQKLILMNHRQKIENSTEEYIASLSNWNKDIEIVSKDWKLTIQDSFGLDEQFLNQLLEHRNKWNVVDAIVQWIRYHLRNVFHDSRDKKRVILNCLDDVVFVPYGPICDLSTAKNLLSGNKLNLIEKYRLACINCLANQVENMWLSVSERNDIYIAANPLICCWSNLMDGHSADLIANDMWRQYVLLYGRWPALEHFFDLLPEGKRVAEALFMSKGHPEYYCDHVLLKLNRNRAHLYELIRGIVFRDFCDILEPTLLRLWNIKKYLISEIEFSKIFYSLKYMKEAFPVIFEIWNSAPNHLKTFVLSNMEVVVRIFGDMNPNCYDPNIYLRPQWYHTDMRFFISVLTGIPLQWRNSIWCTFWTNIIACSSPLYLDQIMKLCFSNNDEMIQFKDNEMMNFENIEDLCFLLIKSGMTRELMDYLKFCSTDENKVVAVKRKIITSPRIKSCFSNHCHRNTFLAFDKLVDTALNDTDDAKNYKKDLIVSSAKIRRVYAEVDKSKIVIPWM